MSILNICCCVETRTNIPTEKKKETLSSVMLKTLVSMHMSAGKSFATETQIA